MIPIYFAFIVLLVLAILYFHNNVTNSILSRAYTMQPLSDDNIEPDPEIKTAERAQKSIIGKSVKYEWKLSSGAADLCEPGASCSLRTAFAIGKITNCVDDIRVKWERIEISDNNSTDAPETELYPKKDIDTAWNAKYLGNGSTDLKYQSRLKNIFTIAEADRFLAFKKEFST